MAEPSPEFKAAVENAFAPIEELIESIWERLDAIHVDVDKTESS